MTQTDLGKGLGTDGVDVGKQVVYGWEKDQHYPRVDQLMVICQKLNVSADWLLFGADAVSTNPRVAAAQQAVKVLSDEERVTLFALIQAPPVLDHEVEERMPATKAKPASTADEVLKRARPRDIPAKSSKRRA